MHDYKDSEGNIIGHTVRVISKDNGSKKVLPVAYCHNEALGKDAWRLKGFSDDKGGKPIYGLEKLFSPSEKDWPVLVVEGEKSADHAQELFPEYSVISWLGGSQNASKVDWGHLKGRNVAIWPDNDDVGIKCGKVIASNIKALGSDDTRVWVVNPNNLGKNAKGQDSILPNKWDLADDLPEGLSLEAVRGFISSALHATHTKVQIVSGQLKSIDVAKRIEASQRLLGYSVSKVELEQLCTNHERLEAILTSNELKEYIRYTSTKGEFEPQHEFMNLDNKLYREALISIGMSDKSLDIEGKEVRPSEVLTKVEEKHQYRVQSFSDHLDVGKDYSKVLDSSGRGAGSKIELFNTLSRDVLLLHKLQLEEFVGKGEAILTERHKEIVTSTIYDLVKEAKVGSRGDISTQEMQDIADKAYLKLCEASFWSDMSDRPLDKEQGQEQDQDQAKAQKTVNIDHILQGLQEISGEQRIQVLNEQLTRMPNHLRRDFVVGSLVSDMESKFLHKFDEINLSKEGAQNIASLASAICQEQELLQSVLKEYSNVASIMQDIAPNAKLSKLLSQSPQAQEAKDLVIEAQALEYFGLKLEQSEFEALKQSSDLSEVVSDLNDKNINHVIEVAASDMGAIAKDGLIELQEDMRCSDPASYLEYKMHDQVFGKYLAQTNIPELVEEVGTRFGEAIDELRNLDPEANIGQIEAKLCIPDLDQRLEIIEKELAHTFDGKVGEYLVGFNNAKSESEDIGELVEHISKEHEFVDMLSDKYPNAVGAFEKVYEDHQLGKIQSLSEEHPDFIENMLQDLSTLDRLGFEVDEHEFDSMKSDTNAEVGERLFNMAKDHVLEMVHDNAHELRYEDHIEEHGMSFTNRLAYIKHEVYENNFERYLEGSEFEQEIKSMEKYCKQHDMSEEEYMEMDHSKSLDRGMER